MIKVEPARLAKVLASLQKPQAAKGASVSSSRSEVTSSSADKVKTLRVKLKTRIGKLDEASESFDADSRLILVQEILQWEFGTDIVEHQHFAEVADKVVDALVSNERTERAISKIIKNLGQEERG